MAERRMFAKTIIDSDAFLDMPLTTQALYFHLSMRADDDGFVNNPKKIQKMIGASDDDMRLLLAKNFLICFESGVVVIKHWKIHNYIRGDRKKETAYPEEMGLLSTKENGAYTLLLDNNGAESIECVIDSREMRKKAYEESSLPYSFDYKIRNAFWGKRCPICNVEMRGHVDEAGVATDIHRPTIQHNKPLSKGGKHELGNISVICHQCNVSIQDNETDRLNADEVIEVWDCLSSDGQMSGKCQASDGQVTVKCPSSDGIGKDRLVEDRLDQDSLDEYCGESDEPPTPPEEIFIKIPLIDKTDFDVSESLVAEYQETYPALDIRQKLRSMRQWCIDNPTKRKTRRGIRKFIGGWLEREQNSGRFDNQPKQPKPQQQTSTFNRMEKSGIDYDSLFGDGKIGQG